MLWRRTELNVIFFLMIRRPPRSTLDRSSAASDVYKRQDMGIVNAGQLAVYEKIDPELREACEDVVLNRRKDGTERLLTVAEKYLSLIHISEPTRPY